MDLLAEVVVDRLVELEWAVGVHLPKGVDLSHEAWVDLEVEVTLLEEEVEKEELSEVLSSLNLPLSFAMDINLINSC